MKHINSENLCNKAKSTAVVFLTAAIIFLSSYGTGGTPEETSAQPMTAPLIYAHINDTVLTILPAENTSAEAFVKMLQTNDITMGLHDYGGFEKVGPIGSELPRNDEQITTEAGDIILYQGNQLSIYYDENTWGFTRLGKIQNISQTQLQEILGDGDVTVVFSLKK